MRRDRLRVPGAHRPAPAGLIESGRADARVELHVFTQAEAIGDMIGIANDFSLAGVTQYCALLATWAILFSSLNWLFHYFGSLE